MKEKKIREGGEERETKKQQNFFCTANA